jgi:clan AA aspartic protease (TIGR02281 family)
MKKSNSIKYQLVIVLIFLSLFSNLTARSQANTEERLDEAVWTLKGYLRMWSCVPYVEGSLFKENLEISVKDGKLILKQNYSTNDVNILGFPEYTKTIIDLTMVNSITKEENDYGCAGVTIKTKKNGIQLINKYLNNISEVVHPKESSIREQFGWLDAGIRIKKNEFFQERVTKVIDLLNLIAILNGNHLLQGDITESKIDNSIGKVIKMKNIGGVSVIPCKVNGLNLNFIFDTGASNVSISMTEATFMLKNGYLLVSDILGSNKFSDASGNISEGVVINLREIEIGGVKLYNVRASVVKNNKAPLLLGQSALKKLGEIKFDLKENTLTIF